MLKSLQFLKNTTWEEVFATWKEHEGSDPVWQDFAIQKKGWKSWEDWRAYHAGLAGLQKREWKLYEIHNPNDVIPNFVIGPFHIWQGHFEEKNKHTFADLIQTNIDWVQKHIGVEHRLKTFPEHTQFIGIYIEGDDKIVLFEGHHRCTTVAFAQMQGKPIEFVYNPTIALTVMSKEEKENVLDEMIDKPSDNPKKVS